MIGWPQWAAALLALAGAGLMAARIRQSPWCYVLWIAADVLWIWSGWHVGLTALAGQHAIYIGINLLGLWRWLVAPTLEVDNLTPNEQIKTNNNLS